MRAGAWVPVWIGMTAAALVYAAGGLAGAAWFLAGIVLGGWVPLYLMPWLRRRAARREVER